MNAQFFFVLVNNETNKCRELFPDLTQRFKQRHTTASLDCFENIPFVFWRAFLFVQDYCTS